MSNQILPAPDEGIGLCLSGGGYRATLFHIGTLWRLNEFGYLPRLSRISSVSGGSITSGWLGLCWKDLDFDENGVARNFEKKFVNPLRALSSKNLDVWIVLGGVLNPFDSIGDRLIKSYREQLFGGATLQDLPDQPNFVINASNAQSGVLFRFSKPYMADYRVGLVENPQIELAVAVAASSAFPPILSPVRMKLKESDFRPGSGKDLQKPPFTTDLVLMDGGVYDNLGLEAVLKRYDTVLISDAGGRMLPQPDPSLFWGLQAFRVLSMIDNQVRSLRKRDVVETYILRSQLRRYWEQIGSELDEEILGRVSRKGAYWGTFVELADYEVDGALDAPYEKTLRLAQLPTRLWGFSDADQKGLINWGYAACDAAMRKYVDPDLPANGRYPYAGGVG